MTERAAHLVDDVPPPVPARQRVLTLPHWLRYLLAWDHGLTRAVLAVHAHALLEFYRRQSGINGLSGGHTGTLTVIQRFGSGLKLNVHFHTAVFDGMFSVHLGLPEARDGPETRASVSAPQDAQPTLPFAHP